MSISLTVVATRPWRRQALTCIDAMGSTTPRNPSSLPPRFGFGPTGGWSQEAFYYVGRSSDAYPLPGIYDNILPFIPNYSGQANNWQRVSVRTPAHVVERFLA